jgi:hypothetical protein
MMGIEAAPHPSRSNHFMMGAELPLQVIKLPQNFAE